MNTTSLSISLLSANGSQARAIDTTSVAAWVGPSEGSSAADGSDPTSVTTSGTGLSVTASLTSSPVSTATTVGISIGFGGAIVSITTTSTPTLRSYLGDKAVVAANGSGDVAFVAATTATAIADAAGVTISAGFAVGLTSSTAMLKPTVKAFTVGGGSVSGRNVTFNARSNVDASGNPISPTHVYNSVLGAGSTNVVAPAFARVSLPLNVGLFAGVAGGFTRAENSPIVFTSVASGTQITATTLLKVRSDSFGDAQIDALALGVGIGAGIGIVKGDVTSAGTVTTRFDGNSTGSAAAEVISSVKAIALAEGRAAGGSIVAAVAGGSLHVFVKPVVLTAVNGTLVASGAVDVKSDVRTAARAFYVAMSISGFVSGVVGSVTASTDGLSITTAVESSGLVRSTGGNASILAWHNFDGTNFVTANKVEAAGKQTAFSGLVAISSINLTATAKAQVYANVNAGGTLSAPSGTASLMAFNGNYADGQYSRTQGSLISVAPDANPTADASGTTQANLLGHVRVFDGTNSTSGASVLVVLAKANDTAFAGINNVGGGAISIADSNSTAQGTPSVSTTLGGASSVIITSGDISARAFSLNDADASTSSTTGGALNLNFFGSSASMNPTVSTLVTGGAKISGGVITINATSNEAPQQASDGSFNAATDVANGSNTITFNLIHNAFTGQLVVYDAQGGTEIAPNLQDRSINVIVGSDPKSLQLGMSFGFDNPATADINEQTVFVDPVKDIIDFGNRSHHFETGDLVVYQPNGTAIGGIPAGTYKVFKIDAFKLKLQLTSVDVTNPPTLIIDGPNVDEVGHRISGSFSNGQYVTYHAPTNIWSFTRSFVDVTDCSPLPCAGSDNDVIYIGRDRTGDGVADDHNLQNGNTVLYTSTDVIGGLSSGVTYYVIRVDAPEHQARHELLPRGRDRPRPGRRVRERTRRSRRQRPAGRDRFRLRDRPRPGPERGRRHAHADPLAELRDRRPRRRPRLLRRRRQRHVLPALPVRKRRGDPDHRRPWREARLPRRGRQHHRRRQRPGPPPDPRHRARHRPAAAEGHRRAERRDQPDRRRHLGERGGRRRRRDQRLDGGIGREHLAHDQRHGAERRHDHRRHRQRHH